jgi:hypothetical protein
MGLKREITKIHCLFHGISTELEISDVFMVNGDRDELHHSNGTYKAWFVQCIQL